MRRAKNIKDLTLDIENGKVVVASDIHIPFQDDEAVDAFIKYCTKTKPEVVVLNGDVMDMFKLSRFTKGEGRNPYEEINACRGLLFRLRKACPKAKIYYIIGNHETRLERFILEKAPELECLLEDVFTILKVEDYKVEGCGRLIVNDNFKFYHGRLLGNKTGLSAIKELENSYMSGASGHCHKLAKYITRKAGRKFVWLETGCLCSMNPEYMIDPDWQQGFGVVEFRDGKLHKCEILEIENGEIL